LIGQRAAGRWITTTFGDMLARARDIASGLVARGLKPGDRLLILSGEGIDHAALMLGAMLARVVTVPISTGYSRAPDRSRLAYLLQLVRPGMVFADDEHEFGAALDDAVRAGAIRLAAGAGMDGLNQLEHIAPPIDVHAALASIAHQTVFRMLLTSGSTAMPKGVIQTHGMNCASLAFDASLSTLPPGPREPHIVLDWLPWSHVGGSITTFNNILLAGASLYLDDGRPVPGQFDATIRNLMEFPPGIFASPPAGFAMLVEAMDRDPELRASFFSRLIYVKSGAAAMPEEVRRRFQRHSIALVGDGTPILMGYGTTETHGVISVTSDTRRPSLLGLPKPGVIVKLAPVGDRFEVSIKSASVTPGYFGDDAATAAAFDEEGFFRTGDSATIDPDEPGQGLVYAGRIGENFKMATGTWVAGSDLRAAVMDALDGMADDCVVLGEGQVAIGLMIWTSDDDSERRTRICKALRRFNEAATGASRRIGRVIFSRILISADRFERTEKGSLNRVLILSDRRVEIDLLYADSPGALVTDLSSAP